MVKSMTEDRFASLWEAIIEFNDRHFPNWRDRHPVFYSNAIAGEVGEVCGITKRMAGGGTNRKAHTDENPYTKLREEIVDVFIYSILLLQSQHTDLDEFFIAASQKLKKLEDRMAIQ